MANPVTLKAVAATLVSKISILTDDVRKDTYNKKAHILSVSVPSILEQIEGQLGKSLYTKNLDGLTREVKIFTKSVYTKADTSRKEFIRRSEKGAVTSGFAVELVSLNRIGTTTNQENFRILIISISGRGNSFDKAKTLKNEAEKHLINKIKEITGKEVNLDIGHISAVSSLQVQDAALEFVSSIKANNLSIPYSIRKAVSYKSIVKVSMEAQRKRKLDREYILKIGEVFPTLKEIMKNVADKDPVLIAALLEDSVVNQARGRSEEKKRKNQYLKAAKDLANKINFSRVRSSPSFMEDILTEILYEAQKVGGTIKGKKPKKSSNPKTRPIEEKLTRTNTVSINVNSNSYSSPEIKGITSNRRQKTNWLQLIPLINAKLTPQVMKNMSSPRLVNRTGRFAQSARVVNVEQTSQGFPSFVFDYERDPYDVFDRTLGRAPWNSPQRDPRTLIDQSVREIVREMAIGRFFTRRAG